MIQPHIVDDPGKMNHYFTSMPITFDKSCSNSIKILFFDSFCQDLSNDV